MPSFSLVDFDAPFLPERSERKREAAERAAAAEHAAGVRHAQDADRERSRLRRESQSAFAKGAQKARREAKDVKREKRGLKKSNKRKLAGAAQRHRAREAKLAKRGAPPMGAPLHTSQRREAHALKLQRGATADGPKRA